MAQKAKFQIDTLVEVESNKQGGSNWFGRIESVTQTKNGFEYKIGDAISTPENLIVQAFKPFGPKSKKAVRKPRTQPPAPTYRDTAAPQG